MTTPPRSRRSASRSVDGSRGRWAFYSNQPPRSSGRRARESERSQIRCRMRSGRLSRRAPADARHRGNPSARTRKAWSHRCISLSRPDRGSWAACSTDSVVPLTASRCPSTGERIELEPSALDPMARGLTESQLVVGVRAINSLMTLGIGQKIGVFAMPGVGKSMLLGMMARNFRRRQCHRVDRRTRCEAREFIEDILGAEGLARSVLIVVAGDKAAGADAHQGRLPGDCDRVVSPQAGPHNVLLLMDRSYQGSDGAARSGSRFGRAANRARVPTVCVCGNSCWSSRRESALNRGSITGIYTVLVHEENDPIGELAKSVLHGHITLSRTWPAAVTIRRSMSSIRSRASRSVSVARSTARRAGDSPNCTRAGATLKNSSRSGHIIRAPIGAPTKRSPITKNSKCSSSRMPPNECR